MQLLAPARRQGHALILVDRRAGDCHGGRRGLHSLLEQGGAELLGRRQDEVTITVGTTGTLQANGVVVIVPVEITCGPLEVDPRFTMADAELRQAVKRQIAQGFGNADEPIVCDGTPHANTFTILASATGPPFRKGDAAVRIFVTFGQRDDEHQR